MGERRINQFGKAKIKVATQAASVAPVPKP
jgi:hypothetical protein